MAPKTLRLSPATGESEYPDFSPDGEFLAYARSPVIYIVAADGTNRRMLVRNGNAPEWSPNGERILFNRYRTDSHIPGVVAGWRQDRVHQSA